MAVFSKAGMHKTNVYIEKAFVQSIFCLLLGFAKTCKNTDMFVHVCAFASSQTTHAANNNDASAEKTLGNGSAQVTLPAALILARELGVSSLREWAQHHRSQAQFFQRS